MHDLLPSVLIAIIIYLSTDLDNLLLLTVLFADPTLHARAIILGQILAIGTLILISVISGFAALAVPPAWIALLGIIPILLGVRGIIRLSHRRADPDPAAAAARERQLQTKTHSQILAVALITLAHGADNLGVYIPLFAKSPSRIPIYVTVFALMLAASCTIGHALTHNRLLGDRLRRYGHPIIPFILLALGLHILWGARPLLPH